jgi:hypothetical protein
MLQTALTPANHADRDKLIDELRANWHKYKEGAMTMRKAHTYRVGHPSYTFPNHPVIVAGHAQAIRELRSRGCKRDDARAAVKQADQGSHVACFGGASGNNPVEIILRAAA